MSGREKVRLNLRDIEKLLDKSRVLQDVEESRNPLEIALGLGLIHLVELERVETGFLDLADQRRKLLMGQIIVPIAFGQSVLQAIEIGNMNEI